MLCEAPRAALILARPGEAAQRLVARRNLADGTVAMFAAGRMRLDGDLSYAARSILETRTVDMPDLRESAL